MKLRLTPSCELTHPIRFCLAAPWPTKKPTTAMTTTSSGASANTA